MLFSTQDSLLRWLASLAGQNQTPNEGLIRILLHDIDDLTMMIRASLDDIEEQSISSSPVQLQEHATYWRPLLGRYKLELSQLHKSIPDLTKFLDSKLDLLITPALTQYYVDLIYLLRRFEIKKGLFKAPYTMYVRQYP